MSTSLCLVAPPAVRVVPGVFQRYSLIFGMKAITMNCIPLHCSAAKPSDYNFLPLVTEEPGSSRKMIAIGISIVGPLELTVAMVSRETYMTFGQQKSGPPYNLHS